MLVVKNICAMDSFTGWIIIQALCNGRCSFHGEWSKFDLLHYPNCLTDYDKTCHSWLHPRDEHVYWTVVYGQQDSGECHFPTYRKWLKVFPHFRFFYKCMGMVKETLLRWNVSWLCSVCSYKASWKHLFFCILKHQSFHMTLSCLPLSILDVLMSWQYEPTSWIDFASATLWHPHVTASPQRLVIGAREYSSRAHNHRQAQPWLCHPPTSNFPL